jgi:hypothetical protein
MRKAVSPFTEARWWRLQTWHLIQPLAKLEGENETDISYMYLSFSREKSFFTSS